MLAATVVGYLAGTALPSDLQRVAHPLITCAAFANLGAAALGAALGQGYWATMRAYVTKVYLALTAATRWGPARGCT